MTVRRAALLVAWIATLAAPAQADVDGRAIDVRRLIRGCDVSLASPPHEAILLFRTSCGLDEDHAREVLTTLLAQDFPEGAPLRAPVALHLGRIVELPWLSDALSRAALASPEWDAQRGRPRKGGSNAFVAHLLGEPGLLRPLDPAFTAVGARARVGAVEKVLVSPESHAPFDAQLWLRLEPDAAGSPRSGP